MNIYLTHFMDCVSPNHVGYKYFPKGLLDDTIISYKSFPKVIQGNLSPYLSDKQQVVTHQSMIHQSVSGINRGETGYLELLKRVMKEGQKRPSRNSVVYTLFGSQMTFDLKDGFPLLTTKKMGYKTILRELLWFIKGSTNNQDLQDQKVHIWDQNASREFLESRDLPYEEGDLGPVYGFQWRHSGATYQDCHTDYRGQGYDQLQHIIELLQTDPYSRRILMSSWNPSDLDSMALPPCHVLSQFYVNGDTLDCQLYQRSGDMFLGVPFNIASYAFLTHIIAKITGLKAGRLIHILGDTHIYENHREQVEEQLARIPVNFPTLQISDELKDIDHISEDMIQVLGYQSYPKISAEMVA